VTQFSEECFIIIFYQGHQIYNKFIISDRERELFSLRGAENKAKRMKLYRFMLEHMSDEDRFLTTYRSAYYKNLEIQT